MVEVVRYTKIYAEDIDFGDGTKEILLGNGQTVSLSQVNITHLLPGLSNGRVLYQAGNEVTQDSVFLYDESANRLSVPEVTGGVGSGDGLVVDSTSHGTKGLVQVQPAGGNVVVGGTSASTKFHMKQAGALALTIENTDAGTEGDPAIILKIAGTEKWCIGCDDSDSDKFKIDNGATLGASPILVVTGAASVGVNESSPEGILHVKSADAGAITPSASADDLIVEGSGHSGISVLSGSTSIGGLHFASTTSPDNGMIKYDHANSRFAIGISATDRVYIRSQGAIGINNTANASNPRGLTINITQSVEEIISGKMNGIVDHGMTTLAETDTAFAIYPRTDAIGSSQGGVMIAGYSESTGGVELSGNITTASTLKSALATAAVIANGALKSGTDVTVIGANGNVFAVRNDEATLFIVDAEGDVHVDGASTLTVFDDHDDVQLLNTVRALAVPDMRAKMGNFFEENLGVLERGRVVTVNADGHHFVSYKGLSGLLIDAIRQLSGRLADLERRTLHVPGGSYLGPEAS